MGRLVLKGFRGTVTVLAWWGFTCELRRESPVKLRLQDPCTASLGVHEPPQHHTTLLFGRGKIDMDHSWELVA